MDASTLALKMLEWERKYLELMVLEAEIKEAVLEVRKTQVVGNVRARYSGGRRTYDYGRSVLNMRARAIQENDHTTLDHITNAMEKHTTTVIKRDYRKMCDVLGINGIVVGKSDPSVTVKLETP
jgi:hypothetical protein